MFPPNTPTVHGLGSLFISSAISFLSSIILIWNLQNTFTIWAYLVIGMVTQVIVFSSATSNYNYFPDNLRAFQIKILKTYL